jgi:hypothetical protein
MAKQSSDIAQTSTATAAASGSTRRHPARIPPLVASGDPQVVMREIRSVYGFDISEQYARDFIAFVEKAVRGDFSE